MAEVAAVSGRSVDVVASSEDEYESSEDSESVSSYDDGHGRSSEENRSKQDDGSLPDAVVSEAVKKLLQGAGDKSDTSQHSDGKLIEAVVGEFKLPPGHRFYNWNSSHFYPDVHHPLDVRSQLRQRRHSEPQPTFRFVDTDSDDSDRSNSESASSSGSEIEIINAHPANLDSRTTKMPLSAISFQLASSSTKAENVCNTMKVDVDIDSGSDIEDDDDPKTWHRSPLRRIKSDTCAKKPASGTIPSSHDPSKTMYPTSSGFSKLDFERPSIRSKQQAEKRREFLRLRCRSQGWDLDASPGTEQQRGKTAASPVSSSKSVGSLSLSGSISRSQEDIRYVEQSPEWSVRGRDALDGPSPDLSHIDVRGRIRQFEPEKKFAGGKAAVTKVNVNNNNNNNNNAVTTSNCQFHFDGMKMIDDQDQPLSSSAVYYSPNSSTAGSFRKTASSFENIYDSVNLEPEIPAVSEVIELYEQQSHRITHKECRLPLSSPNLPSQSAPVKKPEPVLDSSAKSAPAAAVKSKLDAKSIVEEEKIKFVDYRIEYRRQHSSGNESGSGRSSDEKDRKKSNVSSSSGDVSKPVKIIPPDDYEYILRKIHHNRQDSVPKEMPRSGTGSSFPVDQPQNRRQQGGTGSLRTYAEVKKAMETEQQQSSGDRLIAIADSKILRAPSNDSGSNVSNVRSRPLSATHRPPPEPISIVPIAPDRSHSLNYGNRVNDGRSKVQPDLIPSPICSSVTPVHGQGPAILPSQLPQPNTNTKTKWDETSFPMHFDVSVGCPQPLSISIQPTNVAGKPNWKPPPNENFPPPPDFWNYNTSYEPNSPKSPTVHSPKLISDVLLPLRRETRQEIPHHHRARDDLVHDLVRSLDNNTELPTESAAVFKEQYRFSIQAPVVSVKPEQIEQSHHLPTYRAEDQPKRILAPMPRSQVIRHRQQRTANYELPPVESSNLPTSHRRLPDNDQWNNSSFSPAADSPNSSSSVKATVFSLTGFHKLAMPATPTQLPPVPLQSEALYWGSQQPSDVEFYPAADVGFPSQCDVPPPISPDIYSEPMYWCSDADKRRPIVYCPEVETALNLDSQQQQQQRYFYCSGRQLHGTDVAANTNSDNPASVVNQATIPADSSACSSQTGRLQQQQPQPATVHVPDSHQQQPGSYYGYDFLFSVPSYQTTNGKDVKVWQQTSTPVHLTNTPVQVKSPVHPDAPILRSTTVHSPREGSYGNVKQLKKPLESSSWIQPELQTMLSDHSQQQQTHDRLPSGCPQSRASTRYERHIANEQENYRVQTSAHTDKRLPQEMSTDSQTSKSDTCVQIIPNAGPKSPDKNQISIPSWSWTFDPVEKKLDLDRPQSGIPASHMIPAAKSDFDPSAEFSQSLKTNVDEPSETEEQQLSVAEIKAKLFGPNEDKAKKIFQGRTSSPPSTAFSTKTDITLASSAKLSSGPSKISSSQPLLQSKPSAGATDQTIRDYVSYSDGQVRKRSNIYDVLTDLEKTYEKLDMDLYDSGGWNYSRCDGTSSNYIASDQTAEPNVKRLSITNVRMLEEQERDRQNPSLQYTKEWLSSGGNASPPRPARFQNDPTIGQPPSESGSAARNLPRKIADDMAVRKLKGNVGGKSIPDLASQSPLGSVSGTGNQPIPLRQHPGESPTSLERSVSRRSLPVLSDKDLDRWRSILSHWSQDDNGSANDAVAAVSSTTQEPTSFPSTAPTFVTSVVEVKPSVERPEITMSSNAIVPDKPCISSVSIGIGNVPSDDTSSTQVYKFKHQELPQRDIRPHEESRVINSCRPLMGTDSGYVECESDSHSRSSSAAAEAWRRRQSGSLESDEMESHNNAAAEKIPTDISAAENEIPSDKNSSTSLSIEKSETSVNLEPTEERTKRLQKLREEWFKSPSKSTVAKPEEEIPKLHDTGVTQTVAARPAGGLRLNSAEKKVKKSLYVSPLQNTALGFSKPATDGTSSCGDGKPESPKVSSFKMNMSSVPGVAVPVTNELSKEETSKVPKTENVSVMAVHLPSHVSEAGITPAPVVSHSISVHAPRQANISQSCDVEVGFGLAFKPCISREDKQVSERQHSNRNITEVKTERVKIEPQQYEASKAFERTIIQPTKKTFQSESEQFRNQKQVIVEPNARITRHSTESRTERVYKVERSAEFGSKAVPKTSLFPPRRFGPEAETSDGELTDATDITLDVMVGANQGWPSMSENFSEFSDIEFLSSANRSTKSSQKSWKKDVAASDKTTAVSSSTSMEERYSYKKETSRISQPPMSSSLSMTEPSPVVVSAAVHSGDDDRRSAALAAAKAEMKMYRRDRRAPKVDDDSQLERKRSIKELVSSFEGMTSPFMRIRPRSMEIRFSSSSSSDESLKAEDEAAGGRKTRKKCQLKTSSSFKEFTSRSGDGGHPQVAKKSGDRS